MPMQIEKNGDVKIPGKTTKKLILLALLIIAVVLGLCAITTPKWVGCNTRSSVNSSEVTSARPLGKGPASFVPDTFRNNTPDVVIVERTTLAQKLRGIYGLLEGDPSIGEWPVVWQQRIDSGTYQNCILQIPTGLRDLWYVNCVFADTAKRQGKFPLSHYDLVIDRRKGSPSPCNGIFIEFEGLYSIGIYDTLGNLVRPLYKEAFDFGTDLFLDTSSTVRYRNLNSNWMSINWGTFDTYTQIVDITGLRGAFNYRATFNPGGVYKGPARSATYPMLIDSLGVHLRK